MTRRQCRISPMSKEVLTILDQSGSQPDCRILALQGPLVLTSFFEFQSLVRADKSRVLIIDLSNVPYVDSAGIGALVGAYVSRQNSNRKLALVGVCKRVHDALQVTRVEQLFSFFDSVSAAEQIPA
jgi:anti-sigma B factor antagonist